MLTPILTNEDFLFWAFMTGILIIALALVVFGYCLGYLRGHRNGQEIFEIRPPHDRTQH
jgi:hypothetical protein